MVPIRVVLPAPFSQQREDFSFLHIQAHPVQGFGSVTIDFGNVLDFQGKLHLEIT